MSVWLTFSLTFTSEYQTESLARVLLPILQEYLASDEGRRDYDEWKVRKTEKADADSIHTSG